MKRLILLACLLSSAAWGQSGVGGAGISNPLSSAFAPGPGFVTVLQNLNFVSQSIAFGGAPGSVNSNLNNMLYGGANSNFLNATGVCAHSAGDWCSFISFQFADRVDFSANSNGGWIVQFNDTVQTGAKGSRSTLVVNMAFQGASDTNGAYTGTQVYAKSSGNAGGTGGNLQGSLFGMNSFVELTNGATNWQGLTGQEIDFAIQTGASAGDFIGQQNIILSSHAVAGTRVNAGFVVATQSLSTPMLDVLFQDGNFAGWPAHNTSTGIMMACMPHTNSGNCGTIGSGLDMNNYSAVNNYIVRGPQANGFIDGNFNLATNTVGVGQTTLATVSKGELSFSKNAASNTSPGAGFLKLAVVCGTNAGSAQLIAWAGTSTTSVSIKDNIGSGVTGC